MIKDLIKFTAKIAIVAAIFVYVVAPRIPGMPKLDDLIHLPSWQSVAKFVVDPGDVFGKTDRLAQTINKAPDHLGSVPIVKPHLPSTDQSPGDNLKHLATGGIL